MHKRFLQFFSLFLLLAPLLALSAPSVEQQLKEQGALARKNAHLYYDEIFDRDGNIREQYKEIYPRILAKKKSWLEKVRQLTKKDFSKDNALSPVALISKDQVERDFKREGVAQRGRALLKFLQDHYSGEKNYAKDGIIPAEVVDRIIERAGESGYAGKLDPKLIKFLYGPDIIRDKDGIFRVLEDNTNYLGGQGDLLMARESLWKRVPEYEQVFGNQNLSQPIDFYQNLLARYKAEMPNPKAPIIFFSVPPYPDQEDKRLFKIWKSLGVEVVTPFTRDPKLVKRPDGMYLERRKGNVIRREKVGFMIFNTEFSGLDPSFAPAQEPFLMTEAKSWLEAKGKDKLPNYQRIPLEEALKPDPLTGKVNYAEVDRVLSKVLRVRLKNGIEPGIVEAVVKGQLLTNNTPGTEFINDKEFNTYVEDLVRYYEKEEPKLRNLHARRLYTTNEAGARYVDPEVLKDLQNNMDQYVIKVVDGRGGEGVWVGPKLDQKARAELLVKLQANTSREVIVQEYRHPSVLAGDIVDERILSYVSPSGVYVSDTGWTRGVSMMGDGKVNLSAGKAHEVTVFEIKAGNILSCKERYRELGMHQ
ncbi:MAG: circularly permuted type 2 ATP-grasp protein [Bdellovibrionota bacterium]